MTSKERLLAAVGLKEVDRVAINCYELNAWDENGWYAGRESYKPLMDMIRDRTDALYMKKLPSMGLIGAGDAVRGKGAESEHVELKSRREGVSIFTDITYHTPKGDLIARQRSDDNICTTWNLEHLFKGIEDIDKYESIPWEEYYGEVDMSDFARVQGELGDAGLVMATLGDPICLAAELFEMSEFLVYGLTETDRISGFLDRIHERRMYYLEKVLKGAERDGVELSELMFRICGPEYATPPYLPKALFSRFVTGYVREMVAKIHEYGAIARVHSHGKVGTVLDEFLSTGMDGIDPLEPRPDGDIDMAEVVEQIGDKACLFGNIELKLLEHGSAEEVREFTKGILEAGKKGRGFVIMPTAAPINDPVSQQTVDNYRVFIDTALEYGKY